MTGEKRRKEREEQDKQAGGKDIDPAKEDEK